MRSHRIALFLAAFAAAAAGPGVPRAFADEKDELAQGDWSGKDDWKHEEGSGLAAPENHTFSVPVPGTPTNSSTSIDPDDPPVPVPPAGTGGTPTEPAVPDGGDPTGGRGDGEPGGGLPEPPPGTPTQPGDPAGKDADPPGLSGCHAHWAYTVVGPIPDLYEKETLLTLVLFRTDAFAFVCNGYARSESTWYIDWFATTQANHEGQVRFRVVLDLVDQCPDCDPEIHLLGISELQAKVQLKTQWGGVDDSTCASSYSMTQWSGDVDCSDSCSAKATAAQTGGQSGIGVGDFKVSTKENRAYIVVDSPAGKTDSKVIKDSRTELIIVDRGAVSTYAGGTEDNAQAKTRAGYRIRLRGVSRCGPWGEYTVELKER